MISRRDFIATLGAAGTVAMFGRDALAIPAPGDIKFGYAAITWQGKDLDAIRDVSAVGFRGIQLRSPILKEYGEKPRRPAGICSQSTS